MENIKLNDTISFYRKKQGLTQEELAQKLGVTNQSVSKWESAQCCPDISLIPQLAEIFEISIDELFGKEPKPTTNNYDLCTEFPWPDDETLRIVVAKGRKILEKTTDKELKFKLDGDALNVVSYMNIECNNIMNGAEAKGNINCKGDISGGANANGEIGCGKSISGGVQCGGNVGCGLNIDGAISCGGNVGCGMSIKGDVNCGGDIQCRKISGNVECEGNIIYK